MSTEKKPENPTIREGWTLRDEFANSAMQGMLSHSTRYKPRNPGADWHESISIEAYEIADAMLKQREL